MELRNGKITIEPDFEIQTLLNATCFNIISKNLHRRVLRFIRQQKKTVCCIRVIFYDFKIK